ncbi:putative ribonuclease H-like domain-containing protein [Tanacetum coccineum]
MNTKARPFTFTKHTSPIPQPQALGTTFEAQVRDYMETHIERMKRFENAIFKQREEINDKMAKIGEEERNNDNDVATSEDIEKPTRTEMGMPVNESENGINNEPIRKAKKEETTATLRKKITRKEDIGGNFEIPCNIGGLKHINALVDQGSDVNVMPLSTYMKLTDERPAETDIRLSLASHSYIYHLGIAEDVLVEVVEHVYPVDFVILDIKEDEKRPFILGTLFLTTAKAIMKFDKGTITLRSGKSKISFHRIPKSLCKIKRGVKNDIEPIAPTMTVNRLVLEWEERIKLHLEREMKFDQWKSKNFKGKHHALVKIEGGMDDEREVA